jgi:hypothetical protein
MAWDNHMAELAGAIEDAFGSHTVTIERRTPGSLNTTTLVRAKTSSLVEDVPVARSEVTLDLDGGSIVSGVEYTIQATRLGGNPPARGDTITEGAVVRTIVSVAVDAAGAIYRARCANRAATK